ncbi:MAG: XdhC family protein [Gemmataceae bacterium]
MRELLLELSQVINSGRPCVYCTLVETRGSTPQKAGAAMLVFADGSQFGTLGGGCVEAEVKQKALGVLATGETHRPEILTFNLDDNYGWDDGLICGGRMTILASPLWGPQGAVPTHDGTAKSFYETYKRLVDAGTGCTEAVVLNSDSNGLEPGNRFLFDDQSLLVGQLPMGEGSEVVRDNLKDVVTRPKPYVQNGIAYLPHRPRISVLIVGGGHVGQAVGRLAAEVDFDVWVLDDREMYASQERFPTANRLLVGDIGQELAKLADTAITPNVFCIIVTRGHNHDEEALYHLVETNAGYVGMIGSKRKIKLIYEDLLARGISQEALDQVHAPLGLTIGSQTVTEIAISIVAELIACRNLGTLAKVKL